MAAVVKLVCACACACAKVMWLQLLVGRNVHDSRYTEHVTIAVQFLQQASLPVKQVSESLIVIYAGEPAQQEAKLQHL